MEVCAVPFIAGAFNVDWGGNNVGQIADGITLEYFIHKQLITGDNFGSTPQDSVYQGAECFMEFTLMEYDDANALEVFWPYNGTFGHLGNIGRLDFNAGGTAITKVLLLDHVTPSIGTGTTAATQPTTLTADRAILAEGFPVRMLFGVGLREIPIRMRLYPNASGEFFTTVQS